MVNPNYTNKDLEAGAPDLLISPEIKQKGGGGGGAHIVTFAESVQIKTQL